MKANQLTRGQSQRVMYVESKGGLIDGVSARIGWVRFSKTGRTVYYRGLTLQAQGGQGCSGNFIDPQTRTEYWVSGVKQRGSNGHPAEGGRSVRIDDDAMGAYQQIRQGVGFAQRKIA